MACQACGGVHMSGETCSEVEDQDLPTDLIDDEFVDSKEKFMEDDEDDDEEFDDDDEDDEDLDDDDEDEDEEEEEDDEE